MKRSINGWMVGTVGLMTLVTAGMMALAGCGKPKPRDSRTTEVMADSGDGSGADGSGSGSAGSNGSKSASGGGASSSGGDCSKDLLTGMKVYFSKPEGLTQQEMKNAITKLGRAADPSLLSYLFDEKQGPEQRLTLEQVKEKIPTLVWASCRAPMTAEELSAKLAEVYKESTAPGRDGLVAILLRSDEKWAGGNGDGKLDQKELLLGGAVLGAIDRTDPATSVMSRLTKMPTVPAPMQRLSERAIGQQMLGRYETSDAKALSPDDRVLEWAQTVTRALLVQKSARGGVALDSLGPFLGRWGVEREDATARAEDWKKTARLYDKKFPFMGNENEKLDGLESVFAIVDLNYAKAVYAQFAPSGPGRAEALVARYPRTGKSILLNAAGQPEGQVWTLLKETKTDLPAMVETLMSLAIVETLFAELDGNADGTLTRAEADQAAAERGLLDNSALDAVFGGADSTTPEEAYQRVLLGVKMGL